MGADGIISDGMGEGKSVVFDVTVVHGDSQSHLGKDHFPLQKAEEGKHAKYDNTYKQLSMQVIPMAFEVRGEMGGVPQPHLVSADTEPKVVADAVLLLAT